MKLTLTILFSLFFTFFVLTGLEANKKTVAKEAGIALAKDIIK